ncbi:MAG: hypothetical protein FD143_3066 [Ignavibacteria bacterium]|nr:MAG: hypothetical protein FD143_3066 [Ignavibacteria bacterium]
MQDIARAKAFKNTLINIDLKPKKEEKIDNLVKFLYYLREKIVNHINDLLQVHEGLKAYLTVEVIYAKVQDIDLQPASFLRSKQVIIDSRFENYIEKCVIHMLDDILTRNDNFIREKSGLIIDDIVTGTLHIAEHNPLQSISRGSSYHILPEFLEKKKAIVNVINTDNRCFGYAILSALYPKQTHPNRPTNYDHLFEKHHLNNLPYPIQPISIPEIEESLKITINVYTYRDDEGKGRYTLYVSSKTHKIQIDLLFFKEHYAWIKHFSRFACDISKHKGKLFFCKRCLGHFSSEAVLIRHKGNCLKDDYCQVIYTMPPPGSLLKFKNVRYIQPLPFYIVADFEALTTPANELNGTKHSRSLIYQEHEPCAVGIKLVSSIPDVQLPYTDFIGPNVVSWFLNEILHIQDVCTQYLFNNVRLIMTAEDEINFALSRNCYICGKIFLADVQKVRDHDHITGKFRGAAHNKCNLQLRKTYKIPVFFHNFRGYDSHLMVHALGEHQDIPIRVLAQTMEKYIILSWGNHIVFKDSLQFMNCSLEKLTANLLKSGREKFQYLAAEYQDASFDLLLRKGVFPYDYVDRWEKLDEEQLPAREQFYNKLRNEACDEQSYEHAQHVWREFKCKTVKDYMKIYLKGDVLQLADVFQEFRSVCSANYHLDPTHYVSAPHLSWDAMLKLTDCKLELLYDPAMFQLIDSGLRGGVCMISQRYSRANHPGLGEFYDPNKPLVTLKMFDANNLYGYAMHEPLPMSNYKWLSVEEISAIDWIHQKDEQFYGYIVECDLDYPAELHDLHNEFPLAPERLHINVEMLSNFQITIRKSYSMPKNLESIKLIPSLLNKTHYLCHYRNLKFYMQHGLILKKVHRVIQFHQHKWLAPYIETNQNLRAKAGNEFEKDFFKLMNNSVYGKTLENQKKRTDIRLVTRDDKRREFTQKSNCIGFKIFEEHLAAIELQKVQILIDKPPSVGFTVVELAKLHMYWFYYDYLKPAFGDRVHMLFTDTDSYLLEFQGPDPDQELFAARNLFDYSGYPKDSPFYDNTNNKVIGKFKDETNGIPILEFLGLRPKMYSYILVTQNGIIIEKHRAKGIQTAASKLIRHQDYLAQLNAPLENFLKNRRIGSKLHKLYSIEINKRGLCAYDDKRFLLEDGKHLKF